MVRLKPSFATTFAVIAVAVHALLLPLLYFTLSSMRHHRNESQFVDRVRAFARMVADQLELGRVAASPKLTTDMLDTVILNSDGVYAELRTDAGVLRSELSRPGLRFPGEDDYAFGSHGDDIYYVSMVIRRDDGNAVLHLGFDEQPIETARGLVVAGHDDVRADAPNCRTNAADRIGHAVGAAARHAGYCAHRMKACAERVNLSTEFNQGGSEARSGHPTQP